MKTRLFYTAKFNSARLKKYDYKVESNFNQLLFRNEIVALADNQVLRTIRRIKNQDIDFKKVDKLYVKRDKMKEKKGSSKTKISDIQDKINNALFIPEYITIVIDHKAHYEYLFRNGLEFNGKKYYRFNSSAGQARVSTVVFCSEDVLGQLNEIMDNGRDLTKKLTPSKFNAYKGLSCSATFEVSKPRYCVIPDYYSSLDMVVDFVTETSGDQDDIVEEKTITQEFNRFDGMGLITYEQSKKWAEELELDHVPAQWCIRQNFMKGMLCTFPIHEFCVKKNNDNFIIKDIYGKRVDLRKIDVILTESQFKLWESFENTQQYEKNCKKNKLNWGVSLHTPRKDKDTLKMNYQFLQTLKLSNEDIENMCKGTVDWINGVNGDNIYYTLLFLMGVTTTTDSVENYFKQDGNWWIKALILCNDLIEDRYIRANITNMIKKKIDDACLGVIYLQGNYQVIVSDPYAMMEHVCGLEVKGLLGAKEYYSGYWNKKGVSKIDGMRPPLTSRSEHLLMDLKDNEDVKHWYRHCYTGMILNVHGHETCNLAGSDFDYDIIATTNNEQVINGVYLNEKVVVYEPPKAEKKIFTDEDLYNADLFSFGSIIGQITNKSTVIYSLLENFDEGSFEQKILLNRLKMCTKLQSAQIDKFCRIA